MPASSSAISIPHIKIGGPVERLTV
jgi:hypothetical protein